MIEATSSVFLDQFMNLILLLSLNSLVKMLLFIYLNLFHMCFVIQYFLFFSLSYWEND